MDRFEMELTFDELKLLRKLVTDDLLEKQKQEVCFGFALSHTSTFSILNGFYLLNSVSFLYTYVLFSGHLH